jgi:hypothetical protein
MDSLLYFSTEREEREEREREERSKRDPAACPLFLFHTLSVEKR